MSTETESIVARLKSSGLFQTKGLIGGKWIDAYDGRTVEVFELPETLIIQVKPRL